MATQYVYRKAFNKYPVLTSYGNGDLSYLQLNKHSISYLDNEAYNYSEHIEEVELNEGIIDYYALGLWLGRKLVKEANIIYFNPVEPEFSRKSLRCYLNDIPITTSDSKIHKNELEFNQSLGNDIASLLGENFQVIIRRQNTSKNGYDKTQPDIQIVYIPWQRLITIIECKWGITKDYVREAEGQLTDYLLDHPYSVLKYFASPFICEMEKRYVKYLQHSNIKMFLDKGIFKGEILEWIKIQN